MATPKKKRSTSSAGKASAVRTPAQTAASIRNLPSTGSLLTKVRELAENDAVRFIASGIAGAIATRVMANFSTKYPEITSFIRENLDGVESRLMDYKRSLQGETSNTTASSVNTNGLDATH